METDRHKISAEDKFEKNLTSPRFDEETKAAARPVVPLGPTHRARGAVHRFRNTWSRDVVIILAVFVVVSIAATIIYRNSGKSVPTDTSPTVSETIIKAVPEPGSLAPSSQPAGAREPAIGATPQSRREPQRVLTMHDEPVDRDWKEVERRDDDDEEKISERARKEEKKRLKRLRKEAKELAEDERDSEDSDRPKSRLVGVYTVKRKY